MPYVFFTIYAIPTLYYGDGAYGSIIKDIQFHLIVMGVYFTLYFFSSFDMVPDDFNDISFLTKIRYTIVDIVLLLFSVSYVCFLIGSSGIAIILFLHKIFPFIPKIV